LKKLFEIFFSKITMLTVITLFSSTFAVSEGLMNLADRLDVNSLPVDSDQAIEVATLDDERRLSIRPECFGDADCWNNPNFGRSFGCSGQSEFCVRKSGGYQGEQCSDPSHCQSRRCSGNKWSPGVCQRRRKSIGESCYYNSDCQSGICESNTPTMQSVQPGRRMSWNNKICVRRLKSNGQSCNYNSDCQSGICEFNTPTMQSVQPGRRMSWSNKICVRPDVFVGGRRLAEEVL